MLRSYPQPKAPTYALRLCCPNLTDLCFALSSSDVIVNSELCLRQIDDNKARVLY